ncbi:MAG TPA: PqqD family protein [Methylomirabilota bacterium]|nr:PqqD family protein [Methylomirabilota bacterium]
MTDYYPKQRSDIRIRIIEEETVVLDSAAEQIHQLNPTASLIWNGCDGQRTATQIAAELTRCFDVDYETAQQAVDATLRRLDELGLLVRA